MSEKKRLYLDPDKYHAEMTLCKKRGFLSNTAVDMLRLHAKELSRDYTFVDDFSKGDAISSAVEDALKYWKGFKEGNCVQLRFLRNFIEGEGLKIRLVNLDFELYFEASNQPTNEYQFEIGSNINKSVSNIISIIRKSYSDKVEIFLDKNRKKITIMDKINDDFVSKASFVVVSNLDSENCLVETKTKKEIKPEMVYFFCAPPNAFKYYTTLLRNGILKSLNNETPKAMRNGNKISIDAISRQNNGLINF